MATVTAGSTGSYTFTEALNTIQVSLASNERAHVTVLSSSGVLLYKDNIQTSRTIGPFDVGDVMSLTAIGGDVVYTPSLTSNIAYVESQPDLATLNAQYPTASNAGKTALVGDVMYYSNGSDWSAIGGTPVSWIRRPAASAFLGELFIRDVGLNGSYWRSDGIRWAPSHSGRIVLAHQSWQVDDATDANTSNVVLFRYALPPGLLTENSSLFLTAKASWPGSTAQKNLRAYIGSSQFATTNNGGNASILSAKWEGIELSGRNDAFSQIGEAAGSAGANGQQAAAFITSTANTNSGYRDITIQANWSVAGSGSNKIILEHARLELVWGA